MVVVGMFSHLNMCLSLFLAVRPWTIQKQDLGIWNHLGVVVNWLLGACKMLGACKLHL